MYHVSCNIRLDGGSGSYFRTIIAVDGVAHIHNGLHSIRGSPPSSYFTMVVDGNAYLRVGQRVSVYIVAADQSIRYYIQSESGFSAYFIGRGGDTLHLGWKEKTKNPASNFDRFRQKSWQLRKDQFVNSLNVLIFTPSLKEISISQA